MSTERRRLTRAQVLAWRGEKWSHTDKQTIAQTLDLLPTDGVEFYEEPGRGRVIVTVQGEKAFIIRPGFVSWPQGNWVDGVDDSLFSTGLKVSGEGDGTVWAELSTFRGYERSQSRSERSFGTCSTHGLELPATGVCDFCG